MHRAEPPTQETGGLVTGIAAGGAASSARIGNSAPPPASGGNNSVFGKVVHIGGPHATGNDAISVADTEREAQVANGHWQGGRADTAGGREDPAVVGAGRNSTREQPQVRLSFMTRYRQKASSAA